MTQTSTFSGSSLTLERNGSVTVVASGDRSRKCGAPELDTIAYRVLIECPDDALDENDFIVDHRDVAEYFQRTYGFVGTFPSCERIAANSCRDLHDLMVARGSRPCRIEVTVAAMKQPTDRIAGITARWPASAPAGA